MSSIPEKTGYNGVLSYAFIYDFTPAGNPIVRYVNRHRDILITSGRREYIDQPNYNVINMEKPTAGRYNKKYNSYVFKDSYLLEMYDECKIYTSTLPIFD